MVARQRLPPRPRGVRQRAGLRDGVVISFVIEVDRRIDVHAKSRDLFDQVDGENKPALRRVGIGRPPHPGLAVAGQVPDSSERTSGTPEKLTQGASAGLVVLGVVERVDIE